MTNKEKMLAGLLYHADDLELTNDRNYARHLLDEFNETSHVDFSKREEIAGKLFGKIGQNANVNKPFYCDYGYNIEVGDNFYANYDLTILDVNKVIIGDNVMLATKVSILTASHPIDSVIRNTKLEFGRQVIIGNNVWIGSNVVINPGVKIGNNVVIGSGSVVTKDIFDDYIAYGNPCRMIRKINDEDKKYWKEAYQNYLKTIES